MIERCFRCNGIGTEQVVDAEPGEVTNYFWKAGTVIKMKSVTCLRCLGSGALNYEVVKEEPVKTEIVKEEQQV